MERAVIRPACLTALFIPDVVLNRKPTIAVRTGFGSLYVIT